MKEGIKYYPFGLAMNGRSMSEDGYRFGFNGVERDDDILSEGSSTYSFTYRIHNPALGRFLSVDPLTTDYPWNSTYAFAENRVIDGIDLEGAEYKSVHDKDGDITGFEWDSENAYDDEGNLKEGYYNQYFEFKPSETQTPSWIWDKKMKRFSSSNVGSSIGIFHYMDDDGNEASFEFDASTVSSDPNKFATIESGVYKFIPWTHRGADALQLRLFEDSPNDYKISVIGGINPSNSATYAAGVNFHKSGRKNSTSSGYRERSTSQTHSLGYFISLYANALITTKTEYDIYYGVSEACIVCKNPSEVLDLLPDIKGRKTKAKFASDVGKIPVLIKQPNFTNPTVPSGQSYRKKKVKFDYEFTEIK